MGRDTEKELLSTIISKEIEKDCRIIKRVAGNNGIKITLKEAQEIWEKYSDLLSASWLMLGSDADVLRVVNRFIDKVKKKKRRK